MAAAFAAIFLAVASTGALLGQERPAADAQGSQAALEIPVGALSRSAPAGYAGSSACASCHASEAAAWRGSHHAKAMEVARPGNVLGDFSGVEIEHLGAKARFERDGDTFAVTTEAGNGKPTRFEVSHTFGVEPLQQYLVTFPDGRLQALPWAWDTRPKERGGQRWFHVYGDRPISAADPLHWTRGQQNWNFMCAECHSTALHKGYDAKSDTFRTTFSEISIGCESCHGPGAGHAKWAATSPRTEDRLLGFAAAIAKRPAPDWSPNPATGSPARGVARPVGDEVEACARCHSRRGTLSENWVPGRPLTDTHLPAVLSEGLFEADGQMLDEVFNDQTFKQSLMYSKGVTCGDCHDPHSGKLKAAGAEVCGQCHQPQKFAVEAHTGHKPRAGGPDCVSCHMPARTYMVVDTRHDHSFRIPRPDLSEKLGTPNTCASCHADRPAAWAAEAIARWHGPARKGFQTHGEAFRLARDGDPAARDRLLKYAADLAQPGIVRATALGELDRFPGAGRAEAMVRALADPDPMARVMALRGLDGQPLAARLRDAQPLLADPVLAVRVEAAHVLADARPEALAPPEWARLEKAFAEYEATQRLNADRVEGRSNLGSFLARRGQGAAAESEYLAGLKLEPTAAGVAVNLADLYRQTGREGAAEDVLRRAISLSPNDAGARHALGLALIRAKRHAEALPQFQKSAELAPEIARYAYVHGVALQSLGHPDEARAAWRKALERHPWDGDMLSALLDDAMRRRETAAAKDYVARLAALRPDDASLARLAASLTRDGGTASPPTPKP